MRITDAFATLDDAARHAAARGSLLFHLDLATEMARAEFGRRDIPANLLATVVDDRGYRVIAFDEVPGPRAIADAAFDARGNVVIRPVPVAVPPRAWTLAQARRTIAGEPGADVAIVIPSSDPWRPLEGFALAISGSVETMCIAGHSRLTLDPAGRRIETRDSIDIATDDAPRLAVPRRETSLVSAGATPVELHTYLSLKHDVPLSIDTRGSGLVWRVDGERVSRAAG